jgi:pimeloyl-ACP methyl ester carboxylesterase
VSGSAIEVETGVRLHVHDIGPVGVDAGAGRPVVLLARLALDVATVLERLDLGDVALVGHSFGAQVALLMAARDPVRIGRVAGAADPVTAVAGGPWVQERLADGRLVVLDGCGHYPMFEARDRFDALLADFAAAP